MSSSRSAGNVDRQEIREPISVRWCTVVWDDDVTLDIYLVKVLQRHFGYTQEDAQCMMLRIREEGSCVVSHGPRERMEADAISMHSYGLKATLEAEEC